MLSPVGAVSYTHLDVYKRQELALVALNTLTLHVHFALGGHDGFDVVGLWPVSYTHLDVYKRQVYQSLHRFYETAFYHGCSRCIASLFLWLVDCL